MNLDLRGKRAVVCGSTQGIGRAAAMELAALGAEVTLLSRDREKLATVAAGLPTPAGQRHGLEVADFSNPETVKDAATRLASAGPRHILINNTGGPPSGPLIDAPVEHFAAAFNAHVVCSHLLTQALVPGMREAKYGRIINITSTSVKQPIAGLGLSNTIRAAVANWAKTLAGELGPFGITVNNVLPGYTSTERLSDLMQARAKRSNTTSEAVAAEWRATIPAGRFGMPEEIAAAIAFLASPAASYINGINVPVDGGRLGGL
jgi:3-oxoacyl-[acyl-carrier protein] reductase